MTISLFLSSLVLIKTLVFFLNDYHPKVVRIAHIVTKNKISEREKKKKPS